MHNIFKDVALPLCLAMAAAFVAIFAVTAAKAERYGGPGPVGMIGSGLDTRDWVCGPVKGNPAHEICRPAQ